MKRFLLLFCTVVLLCSLMIVPALAAETITTVSPYPDADGFAGLFSLSDLPSDGVYTLECFYEGQLACHSDPFEIDWSLAERSESFDGTIYLIVPVTCYVDGESADLYLLFSSFSSGPVGGLFSELSSFDLGSLATVLDADHTMILSPEPETPSLLDNVGTFFSQSLAWLSSILAVVVNTPALLIFFVAFVVVGAVIGYLKRAKNL